ncbi:MAG: DUF2199 domain-containing protein [Terracidiphilus sp.]|jgi:hypothetical protein
MDSDSYVCSHCGKNHSGIPFSFAADLPDPVANLKNEEREIRVVIGSDQCIIDEEQFFIRGCIELPVRETDGVFLWGVWARVNERDYDEISENWLYEGRENRIGPFKGRLANSLPIYSETLNLKLEIRIMPVGVRPTFFLEDPDHLISLQQEIGLTKQKAEEYACQLLRMVTL